MKSWVKETSTDRWWLLGERPIVDISTHERGILENARSGSSWSLIGCKPSTLRVYYRRFPGQICTVVCEFVRHRCSHSTHWGVRRSWGIVLDKVPAWGRAGHFFNYPGSFEWRWMCRWQFWLPLHVFGLRTPIARNTHVMEIIVPAITEVSMLK